MLTSLLTIVIDIVLIVSGIIIMSLLINQNRSLEKQLDERQPIDTVVVYSCDTIPSQFLILL